MGRVMELAVEERQKHVEHRQEDFQKIVRLRQELMDRNRDLVQVRQENQVAQMALAKGRNENPEMECGRPHDGGILVVGEDSVFPHPSSGSSGSAPLSSPGNVNVVQGMIIFEGTDTTSEE